MNRILSFQILKRYANWRPGLAKRNKSKNEYLRMNVRQNSITAIINFKLNQIDMFPLRSMTKSDKLKYKIYFGCEFPIFSHTCDLLKRDTSIFNLCYSSFDFGICENQCATTKITLYPVQVNIGFFFEIIWMDVKWLKSSNNVKHIINRRAWK